MATEQKPRTAEINARLWGARATDWAEIQEGTCRPVYLAIFERARLKPGMAYLDEVMRSSVSMRLPIL